MAVMLEGLRRKGEELDPEEGERKARLEQLEQSLPHIKGTERKGLTPEERAMLHKYLAMRLFEQPLTQEQADEYADLLDRDLDHERDITPQEHETLAALAQMQQRDVQLEPEDEEELERLHQK